VHSAISVGDEDHQAGMERLRCIELPEVARAVGDEDEIAVAA
jgi:hypothetical protein